MRKYLPGLALFLCGVLVLAGVNGFAAYTSTTEFCISCHTMRQNHEEYSGSAHFRNRAGMQAQCADCHVPREFVPKVAAKLMAVKDVFHQVAGTVDTPEKFAARRWEMANRVWARMKASDSRECRNCHLPAQMDLDGQSRSARAKHARAEEGGKTCIDCHKGVVHELPDEPDQLDGLEVLDEPEEREDTGHKVSQS